jgi:hypothetical protein
MLWDLKSGDAAIEGSREYADYRDQLISEEEAADLSTIYQEQGGIPTGAKEFICRAALKSRNFPFGPRFLHLNPGIHWCLCTLIPDEKACSGMARIVV